MVIRRMVSVIWSGRQSDLYYLCQYIIDIEQKGALDPHVTKVKATERRQIASVYSVESQHSCKYQVHSHAEISISNRTDPLLAF